MAHEEEELNKQLKEAVLRVDNSSMLLWDVTKEVILDGPHFPFTFIYSHLSNQNKCHDSKEARGTPTISWCFMVSRWSFKPM
jgi:hypothetical protein